ncbi:DNA-binding response regulator [Chryseobacterium shigense]|uniref:Two component transcriptional regulator, LytTR family n=1 Tax=Chryseobacterium shigense TaxID=297244 RepID=A0A1N7HZL1_9FLAO|nr:LytTR family DNA-binding domain-containing protein [Chryseobacterium shigense]PQA90932.1 DNA-binding response regulator [Chryseobacterium shigense]SIS30252.1 two component transcriptional regulator, LytTR family [Chryseobacterium shigense]
MIHCIIVDDEPLAAALLEKHISRIDHLKLAGKAENAMDAYQLLQTRPVDLMFLDIQMPHLTGIEFLKSLNQKPPTIFTTAYRDFAIEGFELEAVDYLLKPITFERFFKSVERVLRNRKDTTEDFIIFKTEGMNRKVLMEEIVYFESQGNDIKMILVSGESIVSKRTLTDMDSVLSGKGFVRIHRSFMINSSFVTGFNHHEVLLGSYQIPVGRSYKSEFEAFITVISKGSIHQ